MTEEKPKLTKAQEVFIDEYLKCFNATEAYSRAYPKAKRDSARANGYRLLANADISEAIQARLSEVHMSADEAIKLQSDIARGDITQFFTPFGNLDFDKLRQSGQGRLVKKIKQKTVTKIGKGEKDEDTEVLETEIELYPADVAQERLLKIAGKFSDNSKTTETKSSRDIFIPAELIAPDFLQSHRAIMSGKYTEFVEYGGRGSTKSSFISLEFIALLVNNPNMHGLAVRQIGNTMRDSVFSQLTWAISELGLEDKFKTTTSPLEIEYLPTKQKIFFRGADDPMKIKSIKPSFGYIGLLWFEELDTFHGANSVRNIEQSAIRGGDTAYIFKSFNPPPTSGNWANKYIQVPKTSQWQHKSDYTTVPIEWLGKVFIDEAEHLKSVNPTAYEHEYMGVANSAGGAVFTNLQLRAISDEEIAQFDRVLHGLDWGFYPDPASYGKMYYDAARRILYVFGEARHWRKGNEDLYKVLVSEHGYNPAELLIADSAEPKSVQDFRAFGANCRGAEKGAESVNYSIKWLQSLTAIVIDPARAPYHAQEFADYEFEKTKDGEIITEYPDKNNHAIDDVRYATNLIWRRRGE